MPKKRRTTARSCVRLRVVELAVEGPIDVVRALASSLNAAPRGEQLELAITVPAIRVSATGACSAPDCGRWNYHLATCPRREPSSM